MINRKQLRLAVMLAHSVWRESRLIAIGAPSELISYEVLTQKRRRRDAEKDEEVLDALTGAVFFVVLQDAVRTVNSIVDDVEDEINRKRLYSAASILKTSHGIDVFHIVDAVYEECS